MQIFGIASLIIGLALLSASGYEYWEDHENKPMSLSGIHKFLNDNRMWIGIVGALLAALGIGLVWYDNNNTMMMYKR